VCISIWLAKKTIKELSVSEIRRN